MALKTGRGADAPPFLVMDVISAANARAASLPPGAPGIIRMEVGQPSTGAPRTHRAALSGSLRAGCAGTAHCGDHGRLWRFSAGLSRGL